MPPSRLPDLSRLSSAATLAPSSQSEKITLASTTKESVKAAEDDPASKAPPSPAQSQRMTFAPTRNTIKSVQAAEDGPPDEAPQEEHDAWLAWKTARDSKKNSSEVERLREKLEETVMRGLKKRNKNPEDSWLPVYKS